ncbi:MAG: hypothetical protein HYV24_05135 [Deltaproteobacteria bacterium]|nr:hypothetical protein [Deltaproteobacteria bacterium]
MKTNQLDILSPFMIVIWLICIWLPITAQADEVKWQVYKSQEFNIEFLSLTAPQERKFDSADAVRVVWHIGFMEDGTNGSIEVTRLKDGGLRAFSVIQQASELRKGIEQSGKTKVFSQKNVLMNGVPAIEFGTTMTTQKGHIWYGITRIQVVGDTLYNIMITCPQKEKTTEPDIIKYLNSLKIILK